MYFLGIRHTWRYKRSGVATDLLHVIPGAKFKVKEEGTALEVTGATD